MQRTDRGVTLIEVLIGIVIVAIASIAGLVAFSSGLGGIGKEGARRAALERARQRMEELLQTPVSNLPPTAGPDPYWCVTGSTCTSASWQASPASAPLNGVPMVVDGQNQQTQTFAQWIDDTTNGIGQRELVEIGVKVWYMPGAVDDDFHRVYLRTLRTP